MGKHYLRRVMHAEVVRHLRCPVCRGPFDPLHTHTPTAPLRCPRGHSFDPARHGYVQLSAAPLRHHGDTPEMVDARAAFLAAGHYDVISAALRGAAAGCWAGGLVVDVGAGTGRHLAGVLDGVPGAWGLATDVSRAAARRAARAHPRMDAVVCDAWGELPLADGSAGVLLNVFAPRSAAEFARVLRSDGTLFVVTPAGVHLAEIVEPLGLLRVDPTKSDRLAGALDTHFAPVSGVDLRHPMTLDHASIATLVGMGPSAWHTDATALAAAIATLPDPVVVTAAFTLSAYRRSP